jgi:transposase-like protein|uniref:Putative transposase ORFA n=1 Tax=Proteus mirabilis TaxID=584 RepID=C0J7J4_PROMI|nr:putative transposase ORFA [Proteus mirabilis]
MKKRPGYSPETRERAVRLVLTTEQDHSSRWAAIISVASKIGCTPETLRAWINRTESNSAAPDTVNVTESERIKALERENRELKRANEILRLASAFFAQAELDRKPKL